MCIAAVSFTHRRKFYCSSHHLFYFGSGLFPVIIIITLLNKMLFFIGLGLLAWALQYFFLPPLILPPCLASFSVEFHWYSVSQSWHSTSSVSPQFQLAPAPGRRLPLLDNAHPCLHRPLISGIPALLVTTGGSGRWGHCLCLACPCHCKGCESLKNNGSFLLLADTGWQTDRHT